MLPLALMILAVVLLAARIGELPALGIGLAAAATTAVVGRVAAGLRKRC